MLADRRLRSRETGAWPEPEVSVGGRGAEVGALRALGLAPTHPAGLKPSQTNSVRMCRCVFRGWKKLRFKENLYIQGGDVTESMVTKLSPFCGHNMT